MTNLLSGNCSAPSSANPERIEIIQPRVARYELPWVGFTRLPTLKELNQILRRNRVPLIQPFQGCASLRRIPRVVPPLRDNPGLYAHNPVGVGLPAKIIRHPCLSKDSFGNTFKIMNTIRDLLIGGGSILVSGMYYNSPRPSPVQEFSLSHPQSIAHDMMRVAQDLRVAAARHEKEIRQMELRLKCAGA